MKKYLISAILSTQLLFSAGIPVIDATSLSQSMTQNIKTIEEWGTQAKRWSDTVLQYKNELQAYESELLSKTGIRDSVQFVKDLNKLQDYAKAYGDDYLDLGKAFANPNSRVGNASRQLFDKYNIFDGCDNNIYKDWEKENCKNKLQREVTQIATVQESNKMVEKSAKNLDDLSKKISKTQDIKESQDIANAINMEIAQLQTVSMKMDMMTKQNEAQTRAEEEQKKQKQAMLRANGQGNFSNAK